MSGYPTGIMPGAGLSKEKANYRHHEQCSSCMNFYPLNSCRIVDGNISPDAVCDHWAIKEDNKTRPGKEYFQKEYEKSKGGE